MLRYFQVDFNRLLQLLMPVRLRKPIHIAWLCALLQPVRQLYLMFSFWRDTNLYTLKHNSQVVYLKAAINDMFDATERRIYILDGSLSDPLFVYLTAENTPLYLGLPGEAALYYSNPQWLYTRAEASFSDYDFIVVLPMGLVYDTVRLNALIDKYRLPSKPNYNIISI